MAATQTSGFGVSAWLGVDPGARTRIYATILDATDTGKLNYWLELVISAGIATLGLVLNSPAVVIGAMLISPLMGPILGAGLGLATGDLYLGMKAVFSLLTSILAAVAFSATLVWALPFHSQTGEILARTQPNLLDLGVALLSGIAGAVVVCRGGGEGGVTALPGVAIAVALMPPLCTLGFGVGSGWVRSIIYGAGLSVRNEPHRHWRQCVRRFPARPNGRDRYSGTHQFSDFDAGSG